MATRAHTVPKFYLSGFAAPESSAVGDSFVWMGTFATGEVKRRSPKNISIVPGLYDGPGGLEDVTMTIEAHLSTIESDAASAIRAYVATPRGSQANPSPAIWRFLAWQASRTPGWMEVVQRAVDDWRPDEVADICEPPPKGFDQMKDRPRSHWIEHPESHERRQVKGLEELAGLRKLGWRWVFSQDDQLELMHLQAWYFQVRHFPRLSWIRLDAPDDGCFITSDRAVSWLADGFVDAPPASLKHPSAQLVAPLNSRTTLVGRNDTKALQVTPREVNRFIACTASRWVVGSTRSVVEDAIKDRAAAQRH